MNNYFSYILIAFLIILFATPSKIFGTAIPNTENTKPIYKQAEEKRTNIIKNAIESIFSISNDDFPAPSTFPSPSTIPVNPGVSPIPPSTPDGLPVNQTFTALKELYTYVGNKVGVPPCVLETISHIEYETAWTYTPQQVAQYQHPGDVIPNCPLNVCSASGHMQMTIGYDQNGSTDCAGCGLSSCPNAWASHGDAVQEYEGVTYKPNVCNLRDSTYASARKLKKDSGTAPRDMNWTWDAMYRAGRSYYGSCTDRFARFQNRTYCEELQYRCNL